jgi:hypothetical protein
MQVFAQIRKVDEAKRLVFGRAAAEEVDRSGEIMDYLSTKPHFQKWSADVAGDTDGKSLGNLRAMHGKVAAGKLTEIAFDDEAKAIDVCAKVVDDAEWKKVLEGVYSGFSIGGSYVGESTVEKINGQDVKRYTARPNELSLVDRPCIPSAKFFEVQKADGSVAKVEFREPDPEPEAKAAGPDAVAAAADDQGIDVTGDPADILALGKLMNDHKLTAGQTLARLQKALADDAELAKVAARTDTSAKEGESKYGDVTFADAKNKKYPIDTAAHIRAAWNYINKESNASKYSAEDVASIKAKIVSAWKSKIDKEGPPSANESEKMAKLEKVVGADLRKGMYSCQQMAQCISCLQSLMSCEEYEEFQEGDNSPIAGRIGAVIALAGQVLKEMIDEELAEIATGETAPEAGTMVELSAKAGELAKAHESALATLVKMLPAQADAVRAALPAPAKPEPTALDKLLDERLAPLTKQLDEAKAELKRLSEQPAPARVSLRAVAKAADVIDDPQAKPAEVEKIVDSKGVVNETASLIKALHQTGGRPITLRLDK